MEKSSVLKTFSSFQQLLVQPARKISSKWWHFLFSKDSVMCQYNVIQYNVALYTVLQQLGQNLIIGWKTLPSWASYGMFFVRIWEKIDHVIRALHCSTNEIIVWLHLVGVGWTTAAWKHENVFYVMRWGGTRIIAVTLMVTAAGLRTRTQVVDTAVTALWKEKNKIKLIFLTQKP